MKAYTLLIIFSLIAGDVFSQQYMLSKKEVRKLYRNTKKDLNSINTLLKNGTIKKEDLEKVKGNKPDANNITHTMLGILVKRVNANVQKLQMHYPYIKGGRITKIIELDLALKKLAVDDANMN